MDFVATHLTHARVMATVPATDIERAREFYENRLGLRADRAREGELRVHAGHGTQIRIRQGEPAGPLETVATFEVHDVETTVLELRSRGVTFEDYDLPGLTTVDGIAHQGSEISAWFRDSEGNLLCVHQST